jgi:uncharacterized membrane protein HdeD (DUF308 family)
MDHAGSDTRKRIKHLMTSSGLSEFEQRIERQFGLKRGVLLAVGLICMVLGAVSIALPANLYEFMIRLVGVLVLGSGATKAVQLVPGRRSRGERQRSWPVILCQVALDIMMGVLLINNSRAPLGAVTMVFGLLFLGEGLLLIYMALRAPTTWSRGLLAATGIVTAAIGLAVVARLVDDPLHWAGVLVGLKLLAFGGALALIAWQALRSDSAVVYEAVMPAPEIGELYAVYFGTAFHLGVYIGNGEIVHYLNDNHVYRVTWEKFLDNRVPEHWTYPDLELVPAEVVVQTALSEVGKVYPYNLLKFNCEHFAVFCKSGGRTYRSKYGQIAGGFADVGSHPFLGAVAELNTRVVEWLAFHFGGPAGKRLSLAIRRLGAAVTSWLVTTGASRSGTTDHGPTAQSDVATSKPSNEK